MDCGVVFMDEFPTKFESTEDSKAADSLPKRKGARVDEWNGLENRQGCKPLGGSNPPPSAM